MRGMILYLPGCEKIEENLEKVAPLGFEASWDVLGDKTPALRTFACGLETIFPTTATVESDFSKIGFIRDCSRNAVGDLILEGTLQAMQLPFLLLLFSLIC